MNRVDLRDLLAGNPVLPTFVIIGLVFGALAAAAAYVISYNEYRQRMLRLDQNPRRMAVSMAVVTFAVFFFGSIVLAFVLMPSR